MNGDRTEGVAEPLATWEDPAPAWGASTFPGGPPAPHHPPPPPSPPLPRRRSRSLLVAAAVAGALLAGAAIGVPIGLLTRGGHATPSNNLPPTPSGAAAAAAAARTAYHQALVAMSGSPGVHYVATSSGGSVTQKIVGDASQDGGSQLITLNSTFGNESFTLILVSGTVYFQGNTPALEDQLGVPASGTAAVQGKWISVSTSDGPYSVVAPGITVADQAQEIGLVPASVARVTDSGATVDRVAGTVATAQGSSGSAHLDIDPSTHLPIASASSVTIAGQPNTSTVTFSAWGTAPHPSPPSGAVPWSTLGASLPPGGYGGGGNPGGGQTPSATPAV